MNKLRYIVFYLFVGLLSAETCGGDNDADCWFIDIDASIRSVAEAIDTTITIDSCLVSEGEWNDDYDICIYDLSIDLIYVLFMNYI